MSVNRGRPKHLNHDKIKEVIQNHVDLIFVDGKVVSKCHRIWRDASEEIGNMSPHALYCYVVNNREGIRKEFTINTSLEYSAERHGDQMNESDRYLSTAGDLSLATDDGDQSFQNREERVVIISVSYQEYENLVEHKIYNRQEKNRPNIRSREYLSLKTGEWQLLITKKLWDKTQSSCAYNFKRHKICSSTNSGYFEGKCNCGSNLRGDIEDITADNIIIRCKITEGKGLCGKRFCRAPERKEIGKILCDQNKGAAVYVAERADELMMPGKPEPPHLYKPSVLKVVKHDYLKSLQVHKDPVQALGILQIGPLQNIVHNLGLNPFFVHYWTHHQLDVYRTYCKGRDSCVSIDATGSIVRKIERIDKSKSKIIYLYICVVNSDIGQFPVSQMITESHNTNSIQNWLIEWNRSGAPEPKEVVCDSSKALLAAVVRAFTNYRTINDYADACKKEQVPNCYIRIDVAHFIKMYANFLRDVRPRVKKFYLCCIGQLILAKSSRQAEEILTALITVCRSETEGNISETMQTPCEKEKNALKKRLTGDFDDIINNSLEVEPDCEECEEESVDSEEITNNSWVKWGKNIDIKVQNSIVDIEGDRENVHYLPRLADRLLKDVKWIPLWSCISRDTFKYGRIPASSAPVESEFNDLKNRLLRNSSLPMRADDFISKHVKYISGRTKLIDASCRREFVDSVPKELIADSLDVDLPSNVTGCETTNVDLPSNSAIVGTTERATTEKITEITSPQPECPACANGDMPTGAHTCIICKKAVHIFDQCSAPIDDEEEGFGQKRLCTACKDHHAESVPSVVASNQVENWRGLAVKVCKKQTKKSRYLHTDYVNNEFLLHDKLSQVPIIKNGSSLELMPVRINGRNYTLQNTCAFDSIFQIFLAAFFDRDICRTDITNSAIHNLFCDLIVDVAKSGVQASSYRQRVQILKELYPPQHRKDNNCDLVDCRVTAGVLCQRLFAEMPSFEEVTRCDKGCAPRYTKLPRIQIDRTNVNSLEFQNAVEKAVVLSDQRRCCKEGCEGMETTTISKTGNYILIETYDLSGRDLTLISLEEVPTVLRLSFENRIYQLAGLVNFAPPIIQRRNSDIDDLGHYTAVSYRRDQTWISYDDTLSKEKRFSAKHKVRPEILIYVR